MASDNGPADGQRHDEFVKLLVKNQRRVHGFILTLLPQADDAEDVLQEASAVAWKKFDQYTSGTDFVSWVCTIARYEVLRYRSRQQPAHLIFDDSLVESLAERCNERAELLVEQHEALEECLAKQEPDDARLLLRCYDGEATIKQVADEIGRPVNTLYKMLARLRRSLYDCMRRVMAAKERTP